MFNEDSLREEIVKTWGEHGAHVEVFDHILGLAKRFDVNRWMLFQENGDGTSRMLVYENGKENEYVLKNDTKERILIPENTYLIEGEQ